MIRIDVKIVIRLWYGIYACHYSKLATVATIRLGVITVNQFHDPTCVSVALRAGESLPSN
jgi:hypothetical protein